MNHPIEKGLAHVILSAVNTSKFPKDLQQWLDHYNFTVYKITPMVNFADYDLTILINEAPKLYSLLSGEESNGLPDLHFASFSRDNKSLCSVQKPAKIIGRAYKDQQERIKNLAPMNATPDMI